jgi:hypothetical protein
VEIKRNIKKDLYIIEESCGQQRNTRKRYNKLNVRQYTDQFFAFQGPLQFKNVSYPLKPTGIADIFLTSFWTIHKHNRVLL